MRSLMLRTSGPSTKDKDRQHQVLVHIFSRPSWVTRALLLHVFVLIVALLELIGTRIRMLGSASGSVCAPYFMLDDNQDSRVTYRYPTSRRPVATIRLKHGFSYNAA